MSDLPTIGSAATVQLDEFDGVPAPEQEPVGPSEALPEVDQDGLLWEGRGRLAGLKALIAGGDSGLGRAVATAYAREGCDVALGYLPEEQAGAEETKRLVEAAGRRCVLLPADLADEGSARAIVDGAMDGLGELDILVNNAGYGWGRRERGLAEPATGETGGALTADLYPVFWVTQRALCYLEEGACIINVSPIPAFDPSTSRIDDAATTAAINDFTVNLAAEVGPEGVRVNAVVPGPIWTPVRASASEGESMAAFGTDTPLGRAGHPSELAGAFVFLASPLEASYVSGAVIGVTGGRAVS